MLYDVTHLIVLRHHPQIIIINLLRFLFMPPLPPAIRWLYLLLQHPQILLQLLIVLLLPVGLPAQIIPRHHLASHLARPSRARFRIPYLPSSLVTLESLGAMGTQHGGLVPVG